MWPRLLCKLIFHLCMWPRPFGHIQAYVYVIFNMSLFMPHTQLSYARRNSLNLFTHSVVEEEIHVSPPNLNGSYSSPPSPPQIHLEKTIQSLEVLISASSLGAEPIQGEGATKEELVGDHHIQIDNNYNAILRLVFTCKWATNGRWCCRYAF